MMICRTMCMICALLLWFFGAATCNAQQRCHYRQPPHQKEALANNDRQVNQYRRRGEVVGAVAAASACLVNWFTTVLQPKFQQWNKKRQRARKQRYYAHKQRQREEELRYWKTFFDKQWDHNSDSTAAPSMHAKQRPQRPEDDNKIFVNADKEQSRNRRRQMDEMEEASPWFVHDADNENDDSYDAGLASFALEEEEMHEEEVIDLDSS